MKIGLRGAGAIFLATAALAALAIGLGMPSDTVIVANTINAGRINATTLNVFSISGHDVNGQIDMSMHRITDVQNPVDCQDVATKAYADWALSQRAAGGGANAGSSQNTLINDGEMADSQWSFEQLYPAYPSTVPGQQTSGGNPGAFRKIVHYQVSQSSSDSTGTINTFKSYNLSPQNLAGLSELQLSVQSYFECPTCAGSQLNVGFVVRQAGSRYITDQKTATGKNTWLTTQDTITRAQLANAGFDLSSSGQPLSFGFTSGNSWVYENSIRFDNFKVTAVSSSLPASQCG